MHSVGKCADTRLDVPSVRRQMFAPTTKGQQKQVAPQMLDQCEGTCLRGLRNPRQNIQKGLLPVTKLPLALSPRKECVSSPINGPWKMLLKNTEFWSVRLTYLNCELRKWRNENPNFVGENRIFVLLQRFPTQEPAHFQQGEGNVSSSKQIPRSKTVKCLGFQTDCHFDLFRRIVWNVCNVGLPVGGSSLRWNSAFWYGQYVHHVHLH